MNNFRRSAVSSIIFPPPTQSPSPPLFGNSSCASRLVNVSYSVARESGFICRFTNQVRVILSWGKLLMPMNTSLEFLIAKLAIVISQHLVACEAGGCVEGRRDTDSSFAAVDRSSSM